MSSESGRSQAVSEATSIGHPLLPLHEAIGLAALVQVSATLPDNYIAFELPSGNPAWWYDIIVGLPDPIVKDSHIEVWDTPGLGISFDVGATKQYLREEDADFFEGSTRYPLSLAGRGLGVGRTLPYDIS